MHKSKGNVILPEEVIKQYGADVLRLWVASLDFHNDMRVSQDMLKQLSEAYRKIRNTARYILGNLGDKNGFDPDTEMVALDKLSDIDKWALSRLNKLASRVREAYDGYQFHIIYHDIHNFCSIDMSKLYIDITKDRLYCEAKNDPARRSAQTAMYIIVKSLTKLLAPILSFTAEETWGYISHTECDDLESVFCNYMPSFEDKYDFSEIEEKYEALFNLRDGVMKALELARADKMIGKSLDAKVTVYCDGEAYDTLTAFADKLAEIYITSAAYVVKGEAPEGALTETQTGIAVKVENADGCKCGRCWSYSTEGVTDDEGGFLCERCRKLLI